MFPLQRLKRWYQNGENKNCKNKDYISYCRMPSLIVDGEGHATTAEKEENCQ